MFNLSPTTPVGFLLVLAGAHHDRARRSERGASAVEWVIIAAVVAAICIVVAGVITSALETKAGEVGSKIGEAGN